MNTWDQLTAQAHHLITRPPRGLLPPSVAVMRSLHTQPPATPAQVCAHLDTASAVLPALARYARGGDPHALLMCAVLMRHPLRRIAALADPDGYHRTDRDARANDTLVIFFTLIRRAAEPEILTARYLYNATLRTVLATRPQTGSPAVAVRVDPHAAILDRPNESPDSDGRVAALLADARAAAIITALEYDTLCALYLTADTFSVHAAATTLGATAGAVERRAQRAIRKIVHHRLHPAAAA